MSVLNILMQLRKCCNHPNLFEPRPIVSPFATQPLQYRVPAMLCDLVTQDAVEVLSHSFANQKEWKIESRVDEVSR